MRCTRRCASCVQPFSAWTKQHRARGPRAIRSLHGTAHPTIPILRFPSAVAMATHWPKFHLAATPAGQKAPSLATPTTGRKFRPVIGGYFPRSPPPHDNHNPNGRRTRPAHEPRTDVSDRSDPRPTAGGVCPIHRCGMRTGPAPGPRSREMRTDLSDKPPLNAPRAEFVRSIGREGQCDRRQSAGLWARMRTDSRMPSPNSRLISDEPP